MSVHVSEACCSINCPQGRMDRKNISSAFQWVIGFLINSFLHASAGLIFVTVWFQTKLFIFSNMPGADVLHGSI